MRDDVIKEVLEEARTGVFKIPLKKAIMSGNKEIKTLEIDLSKLTGQDMIECEQQWAQQYGRTSQSASQTASFQMIVASRTIGIPVQDLIAGTTLKESIAICNCVVSFLIS